MNIIPVFYRVHMYIPLVLTFYRRYGGVTNVHIHYDCKNIIARGVGFAL